MAPTTLLVLTLFRVIYTVQAAVGPAAVRFLVENAGSIQKIHLDAFCKLLCLPLAKDRDYIWDPAHHGYLITRCRNFFRNYVDKEPIAHPPVVFDDRRGPLVNSAGRIIPFAPLLRAEHADLWNWTSFQKPLSSGLSEIKTT